ncbi:MAG TPA: hypothetical protein VF547_09180 [Allosphingosinicella sp.]|jgi:phage terminase large subunit-like protein
MIELDDPSGVKRASQANRKARFNACALSRAKLAGRFPELDAELAGLSYGRRYQGPGRSPDRADAMVWA